MAFQIRKTVFVLEQGVDEGLERDEWDQLADHFLIKEGDNPVGTARLRQTEKGIKIERFAILFNFRGKGAGKVLHQFMLESLNVSGHCIYLNSQLPVISFYKNLGYKEEGELFMEAGIWHKKMIYFS